MNSAPSLHARLRMANYPFSLLKVRISSSTIIFYSSFPDDGQWGADIFNGHAIGCNSVSWAPATQPGSLITPQQTQPQSVPGQPPQPVQPQPVKRFASAGCDNLVKIWGYREDSQSWVEEEILEGHTDWVRDVAWAPSIGLPRSYIATASQVREFFSVRKVFLLTYMTTRTRVCSFGQRTHPHRRGSKPHSIRLPP